MKNTTSSLDIDTGLLDAIALGKFLGVTRSTIYKMVRHSGLPSIKLSSKCHRFSRSAVEKWVLSRHAEAVRERSTKKA